LWAYRLFDRFAEEVPGRLSQGEWNSILNLERFNQNLLALIDEAYMPTQEEVDEAGLRRLGRAANEKDYLINYIQTKSNLRKKFVHRFSHRTRHTPVQEDPRFEDSPRDVIYRLFDSSQVGQMVYADFAAFWTYSWLFFAYDKDNRGSVDDLEIMEGT